MKTSEAVAIIHRGIYREKDAISAYIKFAKAVKDPKAKNVLINLADDEVGHLNKLEKHLMSLLKGKPWVLPKAEEIEAVAAVFHSSAYADLDLRPARDRREQVLPRPGRQGKVHRGEGDVPLPGEGGRTPSPRWTFPWRP